jgi:uncharacterized protein
MNRRMLNLIVFAVSSLLLALSGVALWLARERALGLVHPNRTQPQLFPADFGLTAEDVTITTPDGINLFGWYIAPSAEADGAMLIYVHGLGGNRVELLDQAAMIHARLGVGALLIDLRNHGASQGTVTTLGLRESDDVIAAFNYVQARPEVNPERIGLVGVSMGGATTIRAMARIPQSRLLIAQAAYTSIQDNIAEGVQSLTGLPPFPFAPLLIAFGEAEANANIRDVRPIDDLAAISPRPILFLHGGSDTLIHVRNSEALYAAASEPKQLYIFPNVGHGGLYAADPAAFEAQVIPFLSTYLFSS